MAVKTKIEGHEMYFRQAIVQVDDMIYKVMTSGIGADIRHDPDATAFIDSLTVNPKR